MRTSKYNKGFTLVELAVVIVIIGLIIGAVIKGQELIDNARVNSVITQVNSIRSAFTSFQDKYGALPGDFARAQERIPGCQAAGGDCANGNGNGTIDGNAGANGVAGAEARMAWQHLAFANMITGVVPGADVGQAIYNQNFPGARTGGGFVLVNGLVGNPQLNTLWLRLQSSAPTSGPSNGQAQAALTPTQAATIDRRLDDGNPLTGTVRAGGFAASCTPATGEYTESTSSKDCNLYFQIQ
ncbi:MAG: prepilin-type N-terminal cleavage/methylation domain-containing protein [Bdellovibrionales bacterium]